MQRKIEGVSIVKKIIVIGSPGAGKSTFSRKLRDRTGLPLFYLDMIWHKADQTNITREKFKKELEKIFEQDAWIIDGNYIWTMEMRLKACDTVFFLDYPIEVCLEGATSRIGKKREDLPWEEAELDEEFRQYFRFPEGTITEDVRIIRKIQTRKGMDHLSKSRRSRKILGKFEGE